MTIKFIKTFVDTIIFADYKKEVMREYLDVFADVKYNIVDASGTGTCSGVKQAINLIPDNEPFMLVWSDLILPEDLALPEGYEAQVRPRSGLAIKKGISIVNAPGTIDADYRGEICVVLINLSNEDFVVEDGERIAQMVIARYEQAEFEAVDVLDETERGSGGFGHTGKR